MARESKRFSMAGYVNTIVDFFLSRGWYEMPSNGYYTVALLCSPCNTMVCKISQPQDYERQWRDFYPIFASWVCTQNNPLLPRIYTARTLARYGLFLVIMERLQPLDVDAITNVADGWLKPERLNKAERIAAGITQDNETYITPQVANTISKMTKTFGGPPTDLHVYNMMKRANGDLVITDPYARDPKFVYINSGTCQCTLCRNARG